MSTITPNINKTFISNLFSQEDASQITRLDDRDIKTYRPIKIYPLTNNYNSPICVTLGNTTIFSQIYAKITKPQNNRPNEGMVNFSVDTHHLKPIADFTSTNDALTEFRISIINILEKCLKESKSLDTNSLCIIPGKLIWKITIDVNVIKNDGNIFDAAVISALAIWLTYKIPFFKIENNKIYYDKFINLTVIHMPVCITHGIFLKKNGKIIFVLDTTDEEENVMSGNVSVCANIFGEISYMQMNTQAQIGIEEINELISIMDNNVQFIHKLIKDFARKENKRVEKLINISDDNNNFIKEMEVDNEENSEDKEDKESDDKIINNKKLNEVMNIEDESKNKINILSLKK